MSSSSNHNNNNNNSSSMYNNTNNTNNNNNTTQPMNINNLVPLSVRPKLLQYVEEHITSLISDAISIQRHTKRARLNPQQQHQQVINPVDGTSTTSTAASTNTGYFKTRLHAADINLALQLKGCEKLYGNIGPSSMPSLQHQSSSSSLYTPNTSKVMLSDVLKEDIPSPPEEVSMKQHWLVIDGTVPTTNRTNMTLSASSDETALVSSSSGITAIDLSNTYESSDVLLRIHQLQSGLLSEELKLYFLRVIHTLEPQQQNNNNNYGTSTTYYDEYEQDKILLQLQIDDGLQELIPFFIRYTQHAMYEHIQLNQIENCILIVRFLRSLLYNPTIHLELHLHEILPSLMTCVVAKSFGTLSSTTTTSSILTINQMTYHYHLRNEAAITLAICTNLFSNDYTTLKSRILRTLCQALEMEDNDNTTTTTTTTDHSHNNNTNSSLASRYGGIVAISLFGNRAIDAFIIPLIVDCWDVWEDELCKISSSSSSSSSSNHHRRNNNDNNDQLLLEMEITMCQYAVLNSFSTYLQTTTLEERSDRLLPLNMNDILGDDRMILLTSDYNDGYNMCFV